jgi:hypothetical protein
VCDGAGLSGEWGGAGAGVVGDGLDAHFAGFVGVGVGGYGRVVWMV